MITEFEARLAAFDYQPHTRLVFGPGTIDRAGELAVGEGARSILVVTDSGLVKAGHAARLQAVLEKAGLTVHVYDRVRENPTTRDVDDCVAAAKQAGVDFIIGLGGGSSMDTAKGCNFILTNGGRMQDYWGVGKATKEMLPLIAIPTTSGTGSECQSFAVIADEETHQKMACGDKKAAAKIALLDPELTVSMPPRVTACTGIDALTHALETAVTIKRNPLSLMFSHEAFKLIVTSLPRVLKNPADLEARGRMMFAASLAGTAIENSMLGAAHSSANPLSAHFNMVHGEAVGLMMPHVVKFNAEDPAAKQAYAELASGPEIACVSDGLDKAVAALIQRLNELLNLARMAPSLADCGVMAESIPALSLEASKQWTANFNPRPITTQDFVRLYEAAMQPRD